MTNSPFNDPRFADPQQTGAEQLALPDWERAELQPPAERIKRERVLPRKVLIGWALATIAVYFGFQIARIAIKESFKQAAIYTTGVETSPDKTNVIYTTPNGKLKITRNRETGMITITKNRSAEPPPAVKASAPPATTATPAEPPTPAPNPAKR
ncbi:MAG: hypothetical protein ABR582_06455 [Gemmatimonadaceae bacterium]